MSCIHFLKIVIYFILFSSTPDVLVNRTIDDQLGDEVTGDKPIYQPSDGKVWVPQGIEGGIKADRKVAHNGTWTAASYHGDSSKISITLEFKGTAIYVFFILSSKETTGCLFTLDGNFLKLFFEKALSDTEYNVPVLSKTVLANSDHTLQISASGSLDTYINFDYAIYTVDEPLLGDTPPTSTALSSGIDSTAPGSDTTMGHGPTPATTTERYPSKTLPGVTGSASNPSQNAAPNDAHRSIPIPMTVGIVLGTLAFIVLLLTCSYYLRLRLRSRCSHSNTTNTSPLDVDGASSVSEAHTNQVVAIIPFKWAGLKSSRHIDTRPYYPTLMSRKAGTTTLFLGIRPPYHWQYILQT
ncbi:hypothetical protein AMATHDRAFT_65347 [Amanita thiersii Skay4041]|uniref:Uncharacterized protein n=1 Tax=Amanita thiersii Skay4041 TaxID=703135 RepID=A0A2A9ND00_9AGAR|nr:hypothetical protein AMATHDRAFT_65347 [Amanita thiersii Skay4041]